MRRFPLAFVLVGAMSVLAAGGALLGVFQSPTSDVLAVHNGAGETLQAGHIVGTYTSSAAPGTIVAFDFTAPDHISEKEIGPGGKVEAKRSVTTPQASEVLGPVRQLLSIHAFSAQGGYYQNVESAKRVAPVTQRAEVTGTYRTRVTVAGGYVVDVLLRLHAKDASRSVAETVRYRLSQVDGWTSSQ